MKRLAFIAALFAAYVGVEVGRDFWKAVRR